MTERDGLTKIDMGVSRVYRVLVIAVLGLCLATAVAQAQTGG